ncbi:heavy metal-associated domain-containing protein [Anaerofustis sp.]|uniref:heavy-metal-associated domain-containing protein n=1 Tax=Anaerofustis sp. TaxID=1872517 RepID=UPI0025B90F04|nr:heavy metal-associated domain-containing protein [Anaerofustis sp.]
MIATIIFIILVLIGIITIKTQTKRLIIKYNTNTENMRKIEVQNKDTTDYLYEKKLSVKGIESHHNAEKIEEAINSINGVWAKVDLNNDKINILLKENISNEIITDKIKELGYEIDIL